MDYCFASVEGVTLGLYAGMSTSELQRMVVAALHLPSPCAGFLVAPEHQQTPRLVPLSVAAQAPQLLTGRVSALRTPQDAIPTRNEVDRLDKLVISQQEQLKKQVETQEETLQAELVSKRVAAIGRKVFSPQVQTQVLALAAASRDSWGQAEAGRFATTTELLAVVERLLDKHALPEEHGAHLVELVLAENRVLLSAWHSYKADGSLVELETTAKRLAALGCDPPKPIANKVKSKGKSPRRVAKQGTRRERTAAAATPSAVSVVRSLHAQHMLTSLELDIVQALVSQEDSQVLQILRDFEQSDHRDVGALRDALVSIVEEITMELGDEEKAAAAFARGVDDAVREEKKWGDDEETWEDSDDMSSYVEWQRRLRYLIGQWESRNLLVPVDAMTLRRLVADRHNLLESAYEVYAGDGDGSELLDTLQRVAKLQRQIEQTQMASNDSADSAGQRLHLEDVVRQMQRRGSLKPSDAAGLLLLFHGDNEALQAANEAFQADGDVHELEETLLLVVKHAKFGDEADEPSPADECQAVSHLLAELGKTDRLEKWQLQLLLSLSNSHDARLLAAVNVYNEDHSLEELVDTLEILVELAAWERHRRAMVHDWIAPLARSGKLPRGGAERLVQLVKARDDRVVAALVVFLSDGNKEEFVDTLTRIACLEAMKLKNVNSPVSSQPDSKRDESEEGHLVLALLKELEESGVLSGNEREHVETLVCTGDPRMLAALDVLATTHDAEDFADTTRRILAIPDTSEAPQAALGSPSASAVRQMEKQLRLLASELELPEAQAQALQKAIADLHDDVASAVESYLRVKDAEVTPSGQESDEENVKGVGSDSNPSESSSKLISVNAEDQLKEALRELARRLAPKGDEQEQKQDLEKAHEQADEGNEEQAHTQEEEEKEQAQEALELTEAGQDEDKQCAEDLQEDEKK